MKTVSQGVGRAYGTGRLPPIATGAGRAVEITAPRIEGPEGVAGRPTKGALATCQAWSGWSKVTTIASSLWIPQPRQNMLEGGRERASLV